MKYKVYISVYNSFEVEADSEDDAVMQVRELDVHATLNDCDFNIAEVEKLEEIILEKDGNIHSSSTSSMEVE